MVQIAICDDNPSELANLTTLINEYKEQRQSDVSLSTFQSAIDLLEAMKSTKFDIIFLDVLMPLMSGMDAAHEIRCFDKSVNIIFLTSSPEFAVESYSIKAFHYTLKPITDTVMFTLLDDVIQSIDIKIDEALIVKHKSSVMSLAFFQIEALEISGKTLYFYLSDGSVIEAFASLSEFEPKLLCRSEFMKTHRSFIVNIKHIKSYEGKDITTRSGKKVLVAKSAYAKSREQYMNYLFEISSNI